MNANQHNPLTTFLSPPNRKPPVRPASGAGSSAADLLAKANQPQISPGADNSGQLRTSQATGEAQISPSADNSGHLRTPPASDPAAISPSADNSGQLRTAQPEISRGADNSGQLRTTTPSTTDLTLSAPPNEATADSAPVPPPRFQRSDELMAVAIANGASLIEAAEQVGVCEKTARRRWAEEEFRQRILEIRCQIRCQAVGELTHDMQAATAVLRAALGAKSESVRVSAARAILKLGPDIGGRAEENALLARALEKLKEELARAAAGNG